MRDHDFMSCLECVSPVLIYQPPSSRFTSRLLRVCICLCTSVLCRTLQSVPVTSVPFTVGPGSWSPAGLEQSMLNGQLLLALLRASLLAESDMTVTIRRSRSPRLGIPRLGLRDTASQSIPYRLHHIPSSCGTLAWHASVGV